MMIENKLEKVNSRVDRIVERLTSIDKLLQVNNVKLGKLEQRIKPLEKHVALMKLIGLLGLIAAVVTL